TDGDGSHGSTSKTPSYTKSVSWHHYHSEALNKLNMMPGLGDETHPANSARGRTWIFGGDIRF
ncbi:hypothetical protein RNP69_24335, partial [Escherichia coli]|nr:hypothetical protein [Escherichia coli]